MDLNQIFDQKQDAVSLLICGRSKTGKTVLMKHICKIKKQRVIVLSGGAQFKDLPKIEFFPIYENLLKLEKHPFPITNVIVIIDDLVKTGPRAHNFLRSMIMHTKRHKNVTLLISIHTFLYTKMMFLLNQLDYICFTSAAKYPEGDKNVRGFMQQLTPSHITLDNFRQIPPKGYMFYNTRDQSVFYLNETFIPPVNVDSPQIQEQKDILSRDIKKMLEVFPSISDIAICHLYFLLRNLHPSIVNEKDFSVTFKKKLKSDFKKNKNIPDILKISLIDYLVASQDETKKPSRDLRQLHRYFGKRFKIPRALVKNPYFK